jgi:hypothetical protein
MSGEQLAQRCQALEAELERLRAAATADLQNLQHDIVAKNREIGRLKAELAQHAEDTPEAADAKKLCCCCGATPSASGHKGIDVTLDSDRGRAVVKAVRKRGADRVRKAILGVTFDDWAMGRTGKQDRPYNDIAKHILKDSDRFEHFEKLFEDRHPEGANARRGQIEPAERVERPAGQGERRMDRHVDTRPPIDRVLWALPGDCRPTRNPDEWEAQCPAHDDQDPSLVIRRNPDGMVWIKCWAGCPKENILEALGLTWSDLWEYSERDQNAVDWPSRKPHVVPPHLVQAMKQIVDREERRAA